MKSPLVLEVIHGDALDASAEFLADFDALICDPPFSEHVHENMVSCGGSAGRATMGVKARDLEFSHLTPELRSHLALATNVVKRWSVVFTDHEGAHEWRRDANSEYIRTVPWIRWSQPQLSGDRPPSGSESTLWFHRQIIGPRGGIKFVPKHWNGPGNLTHLSRRCMRGKDKHDTEKPLDLMLDLVCFVTDPGEAVIDLCAGSGATAQACRLLGRNCVAIESDERWARYARSRLGDPLSDRDRVRAQEWCVSTHEEASSVPVPSAPDGSDVKTYERAQRRLADVQRMLEAL